MPPVLSWRFFLHKNDIKVPGVCVWQKSEVTKNLSLIAAPRLLASIWLFPLIRWYSYSVVRPLASADLRFFSLLHFRHYSSSNLHFRQFNSSKTRIVDKVEMRNLSVLIELAAKNWFQPRQRIASSHRS